MGRRVKRVRVFVSHAAKDRKWVKRLISILQRHGIAYWYSAKHLKGAQQWHDEIGKALVRSNWLVVVLTPDSVKSRWVKREVLFALNDDKYEHHIVPVMAKACQPKRLSWTLGAFQQVDFTGGFDAGCIALLKAFGKRYHNLTKSDPKKSRRNS